MSATEREQLVRNVGDAAGDSQAAELAGASSGVKESSRLDLETAIRLAQLGGIPKHIIKAAVIGAVNVVRRLFP